MGEKEEIKTSIETSKRKPYKVIGGVAFFRYYKEELPKDFPRRVRIKGTPAPAREILLGPDEVTLIIGERIRELVVFSIAYNYAGYDDEEKWVAYTPKVKRFRLKDFY